MLLSQNHISINISLLLQIKAVLCSGYGTRGIICGSDFQVDVYTIVHKEFTKTKIRFIDTPLVITIYLSTETCRYKHSNIYSTGFHIRMFQIVKKICLRFRVL